MKFSAGASLAITLLPLVCAVPAPASSSKLDAREDLGRLAHHALTSTLKLLDAEESRLKKLGQKANCTSKNISIRKEFGSLTKAERKAYTDAVLCLQSKTANTPSTVSTGARSRFDDFIVTHILQTPFVHYSGTFLGWHRYYMWIYEQSLKTECGFKGSIPYWEWSKWADAPQDSPIFNGDAYSMGSNGEYIPHEGITIVPKFPGLPDTPIYLEPGVGGGCIKSGPFKDYVVNLGPLGMSSVPAGPEGGLGHNPRCMKRDVGPAVALKYTTYPLVLDSLNQKTLEDFQYSLQGKPGSGTIGPHGGGHYTIGGNPGGDFFVSPGDPMFYLHHTQIDRLWTIWQAVDPTTRQYALSGTNTMLDNPPSANTTLDFKIDVGYAGGGSVAMQDVLSTTAGLFCYIYV